MIGSVRATRPGEARLGAALPVLCLLPDLDVGGAQRTVVNLVNTLPRDRIEPTLVVARGEGPARTWLDPTVPLIDLRVARTRDALLPLRALISKLRPKVVFATIVDASILAAAATFGRQGAPALVLRETNSHRWRGDLGWMRVQAVKWAYRRATRVVALSEGIRHELIDSYSLDASKCVTIHNPVDIDGLAAAAAAARQQPPPWSATDDGGPMVVAVGRLHRQKGFDTLLHALAMAGMPDVRLTIVGEGTEREPLKQLAASLGLQARVWFAGQVLDPVPWYAHADLFVLSSRWEGFGHVIVEAMACGTPVIATDCPYGPADIVRNGIDGRLVPPENPAALAGGIAALLAAPTERKRLADNAVGAIARFAPRRIAAAFAALFHDAAMAHST